MYALLYTKILHYYIPLSFYTVVKMAVLSLTEISFRKPLERLTNSMDLDDFLYLFSITEVPGDCH